MPETYLAGAAPLPVFLGVCKPCTRPIRVRDDSAAGDRLTATCPDCGGPAGLERLYGTVTRMDCAGACMGAVGPNCSCACGGMNHGGAYSKSGEMLAGALERYRAAQAAKAAERDRRAATRSAKARDEFAAWHAGHASVLGWLTGTDWTEVDGFLAELADQVDRGKMLSDRQLECVERNRERYARREARRAEQAARAVDVPAGRHDVEGVIVGTHRVPDDHSYSGGDIIKIIVDCDGYVLYGTAPSALLMDIRERVIRGGGTYDADRSPRGYRVAFTATLVPGDEKGRGKFRNPRKVRLVEAEPALA